MPGDIKAAADRLQRVASGEAYSSIYRDTRGYDDLSFARRYLALIQDDESAVVRHFLDSRPLSALSDDEWREMGFETSRSGGWCRKELDDRGFAIEWFNGTIDICGLGVHHTKVKTAGQLRAIVFGLGE